MSNTVVSNTTPVTSRKYTETEHHKKKKKRQTERCSSPPPAPHNICALRRALDVKAETEASHGGLGKEKWTENEATSGLDPLSGRKILQVNGKEGGVARVCSSLVAFATTGCLKLLLR